MLRRLLTRLYSHLLKLYPDRFMDAFGDEMSEVFSHTLAGLDDSGIPPITRRLKMARSFCHEVWDFPRTFLDARRYKVSLGTDETPADRASRGEGMVSQTWVEHQASWFSAFVGALPFLLFGLAYLLEGIYELRGLYGPVFNLLDGRFLDRPLNYPVIVLTPPIGVYFVTALGLLFGILKGFPRWSYAYLGMCILL